MNKKIIYFLIIVMMAFTCLTACKWFRKDDPTCESHIDSNGDGACDNCGASVPITPPDDPHEDKIEAIGKCTITVKEGEGYAVTAPKSVIKGNSFSFSVAFSNYFDSTNAVVSVNGSAVTPDENGSYNVSNVQADVEIAVSGITRTHYGVVKNACLGATVVGDDRIAVGGNYSFTLALADSATGTPVVKANGEIITANDGVYTVIGQNKNVLIEVTGITVPLVEATYEADSGYTVVSNPTIVGDDFSFSVHIDTNYENHTSLVVKANGAVLESVDGVYTVPNAPKDVAITVEGLSIRETITISFANCDLEPITIYKATAWKGITPVRDGYLFDGWEDAFGHEIDFDYMSDITLYATWITEDGINYINQLTTVANKIESRSTEIKDSLWQMNISDKALADEYTSMLGHHTEYELASVKKNAVVDEFIARTEYVSSVVVSENAAYGANDNAVRLFFTVDGELTTKGASILRSLASGDDMDGIRYNIQNKNADNQTILDYSLEFGRYNFKELCEEYGKVTFWLSTNAEGLSAQLEGKYLFVGANNTTVKSGGKVGLYRIDIQNGMVFVNTEYAFDLSETAYAGETEFSISIHRLDIPAHQYAFIQVSNIYCGIADASLIKVEKTSESFGITNMLSASYTDGANGTVTYTRTDVSDKLDGDKYNIQKTLTGTDTLVLDYLFTIKSFNYKTYCDMYGSVSFEILGNYSGMTVSIGGAQELTLTADVPLIVTIQNGGLFVDNVYICDLAEDVYNGTSALIMNVHRLEGNKWAAFHVSNLTAGPASQELVKP